jgi:two-component system, chemotaxis family, protein-glutamate methylesterase/glutaminase
MPVEPVVAIGASSGGLDVLSVICSALPPDFPAPILVVVHTAPSSPAVLSEILGRAGPLRSVTAQNGQRLISGHVYVAPPDRHLLVEPGTVRLTKGPKENRFRPAVDPLFRSVAQLYGPRAIGVVLSGNLDDGTAGLWTIKQMGGTTIVQDPKDAQFSSMPQNAVWHVAPDYVIPGSMIGQMLDHLVRLDRPRVAQPEPAPLRIEVAIAKENAPVEAGVHDLGGPSAFTCPECHGVLLAVREGDRERYRCHTGHAYSLEALLAHSLEAVEDSAWNALRAMQERALLLEHAAEHKARDDARAAARLREQAVEERRRADVVRGLITQPAATVPAP